MMIGRVVAVATVVLAVVGCGDDGNEANGGWTSARSSGSADEAPQIQVVALSGAAAGDAHGSGGGSDPAHEEAADAETAETGDAPAGQDPVGGHDGGETDDVAHSDHEAEGTDHEVTGSEQGPDASERDATDPDQEPDGSDHDPGGPAHDSSEPDQDHADEVADSTVSSDGGHVVEVAMFDFGYVLDRNTVPVGEPVTFRFVNEGQIEHEAMFGSMHQQEEFASADGHGDHGSEGHHGEIAAITLDVATAGEMVMIFDSLGEVLIGCHLPGHWDAGMVASLEVVAA